MIKTGLASVTFRKLSAKDVLKLASAAKIDGIEWGGDLHVPPGDLENAREIGGMTVASGLQVIAYGSYYRLGVSEKEQAAFEAVLETAKALNAPVIRVWAGNKGSADTSAAERENMIHDCLRIAEAAEQYAIEIALEYHENTLTDTVLSAARLMRTLDHQHIYTYWQPLRHMQEAEKIDSLRSVLPWVKNIHVQQIKDNKIDAVAAGKEAIKAYLDIAHFAHKDCYAIIEFVKNDSAAQFIEDAAVLKSLIAVYQD